MSNTLQQIIHYYYYVLIYASSRLVWTGRALADDGDGDGGVMLVM